MNADSDNKNGSSTVHLNKAEPVVFIEDLTALVHRAEEGGWWAEVTSLPGCLTQGETLDEVVDNLSDAVQGWISAQTPETLQAKGIVLALPSEASTAPLRLPRVRMLELAA